MQSAGQIANIHVLKGLGKGDAQRLLGWDLRWVHLLHTEQMQFSGWWLGPNENVSSLVVGSNRE